MNLLYKSTRNADKTVTASQAILKGLAEDGGLFVPTELPKLDVTMDELKTMSYQETAYAVMKLQVIPERLLLPAVQMCREQRLLFFIQRMV